MDYYEELEFLMLDTVEIRRRVERRCSKCKTDFIADTQWIRCCDPCRRSNRRDDTGITLRVRLTSGKKETS